MTPRDSDIMQQTADVLHVSAMVLPAVRRHIRLIHTSRRAPIDRI